MRVTINCRSILRKQRTGIGRYTYHLVKSLGEIDQNNTYALYARKKLLDFKRNLPHFPYDNFKREVEYFDTGIPPSDIYHVPCPDQITDTNAKVVVTIHDLVYKVFPQGHTAETIDTTHQLMSKIVARADRIICISASTRRDFHNYFQYPSERTSVVLNGLDHGTFHPLADLGPAKTYLGRIGVQEGFILFVGTIEPRKNLQGLLAAVAHLKKEGKNPPKVVVAGMPGWKMEPVTALLDELHLKQDVIFTGFINDEQLNMLYNTCGVFVFPSFYEGFGFPILEASAAGAAVAVSNTPSAIEVAGPNAFLFDPSSVPDIARAVDKILGDENLRRQLRMAGLARAQQFTFTNTARETLAVYWHLM